MTPANRRRHARHPLATPVVLVSADGRVDSFRPRDVSAGGIYLFSPATPAIGTSVTVEIVIGSRRRISASGVVVRAERGSAGEGGFAVRFQSLPAEAERELQAAIEAATEERDGSVQA